MDRYAGKHLVDEPPVIGMECLGLLRVPELLVQWRAGDVSSTCSSSCGESSVQHSPLPLLANLQIAAFALGLSGTSGVCLSFTSGWSRSFSECSTLPDVQSC